MRRHNTSTGNGAVWGRCARTGWETNLNQRNQIKIIAASLCAAVSMQVWAGLGGLQVQSGLGEPFSGSIVVTGEEAKLLLSNNNAAVVTGAPLRATVVRQGDNAVIRLRSSQPIQEPLLSFGLTVGGQGRQYSAMMDPPNYQVQSVAPKAAGSADNSRAAAKAAVNAALAQEAEQKPSRVPQSQSSGVQRNAAAPVFAGQRYTVQPQENLIDVARKVQPQGLTLAQTMRALVKANPRAFRNGNPDLMYKNVTLQIPTAEQMRTLAKQPVSKPAAPVTAAPQPRPTAPSTEQTTTTTQAPVEPVDTPVSAPVAAPQPVGQADLAASTPIAASAVMASEPAAASVVVPAPVAPPQPAAKPTPPAAPEAGFLDGLWPYLAGGAAVLLLALLLLRRRQQARAHDEEAVETVVADEEEIALADKPYAVGLAGEDAHNEDDVVFTNVEQTIKVVETPENTPSHRVGEAAVAAAAAAVVAKSATADKAEQDDWSWLGEEDQGTTEVATFEPQQAAAQHAVDDKGGWLDEQDFVQAAPQADEVQVDASVIQAESALKEVDDDWLQFDAADLNAAAETPVASVAAVATAEPEEDWSWMETAPAEAVETTLAQDNVVAEPVLEDIAEADEIEWLAEPAQAEVVQTESDAVATPSVAGDELDALVWDDTLTPAPAVDEPMQPDVAASSQANDTENLAWDDGLAAFEQKVAPVHKSIDPAADAQQRHAFAASDQDLAVAQIDWAALGLSEEGRNQAGVHENESVLVSDATEAALVKAGGDIESWADEPNTAEGNELDDAPSSVNLSVPLEAKLELAQMYLEIDDAQTARKTLQELVAEADGEILAEAKSLLAQLGD